MLLITSTSEDLAVLDNTVSNMDILIFLKHFLKTYGDRLLQIIKQLTEELDLHLDGEPIAESPLPSKVMSTTARKNNRLTPAKFEAWRMWQEHGLTAQKIAVSLLKEHTSYIL